MIKTRKLTLTALPFIALGSMITLTGCGTKYDLVIYNWEDYIAEGTVKAFEEYYSEIVGRKIKVSYETFSTNEDMYQQLKLKAIHPDLICPSDYMIQKMANDGMLEKFSYNQENDTYGESLENWDTYGSPFIRSRFKESMLSDGETSFLQYAVPYFWGTMGFTYDYRYFKDNNLLINSWEALWSNDTKAQSVFTLKDSVRDSYVAAIFHVYRTEILALDESAPDYNAQLSEIFNRCDDNTIAKVEAALKEAKSKTVLGLEVDDGKNDIVTGAIKANLAWSGDSVYSMDSAEGVKQLNYALPTEGSNVWFDGWCMPKGARIDIAEAFVNFISTPAVAAECMDEVGYTSPIVGEEIWDLVNDWYAADEEETEVYQADLSFYFGEEAKINIPESKRGRQFDAQYPSEETLKKCCIMKDFGEQQAKVDEMWVRFIAY